MPATTASNLPPADAAKLRAAGWSLAAALLLLAAKTAVYWHSHSLGILAEAAHSALDLLATLMTWVSIRIAARPADANHPFGHGKFESFSAFLQTGLLLVTALALGVSAWQRWLAPPLFMRVDAWAFTVMLAALALDWRRSRALGEAARRYQSDALAADELNFSSDLYANLAVLAGLAAVAFGRRFHHPGLARADAVAAAAVALAMLGLGLRLARRSAGVLLDEAPAGLVDELRTLLQGVDGLAAVRALRVRRAGSRYFVDLRLQLGPAITLEGAQAVRDEVGRRLHQRLPGADLTVETEPGAGDDLPLHRVQAVARRHNLNLHDLTAFDLGAGLEIEFHLELPQDLPLAQAHNLVSRLESEMRAQVPQLQGIVTHIEPESAAVNPGLQLADAAPLQRQVESLAATVPGIMDCHEIQIRQSGGHLALSCHCTFPDTMPVVRVHELITLLETRIQRALPELFRVTIHPEPGSDNRR